LPWHSIRWLRFGFYPPVCGSLALVISAFDHLNSGGLLRHTQPFAQKSFDCFVISANAASGTQLPQTTRGGADMVFIPWRVYVANTVPDIQHAGFSHADTAYAMQDVRMISGVFGRLSARSFSIFHFN